MRFLKNCGRSSVGFGAFSLTLTLSRWERGQPLNLPCSLHAFRPMQSWVFERDGGGFSLSQRERAGVREIRRHNRNGYNLS